MLTKAEDKIFYMLLSGVVIILAWIGFTTDGTGGNGDSIYHFLIAKYSWRFPYLFMDHWGKPLYTIFSSPFAQLGFKFTKLFNILCCAAACAFTYHTARNLQLGGRLWILVFFFFVAETIRVILSGLTEPFFTLVLSMGLFYLTSDRLKTGTILLSFLPFARSEGLIIICILLVYLIITRKIRLIPWLITGHLAMAICGVFIYHDLLWVFNKLPYARLDHVYGHGRWIHFIFYLWYILGPAFYAMLIFGVVAILLEPAFKGRKLYKESVYQKKFLLVTGMFTAYVFAHSMFWALGIFGSLGLLRVLIGAAPLMALLCLTGFDYALQIIERFKMPFLKLPAHLFLGVCAFYFLFKFKPTAINFKKDFSLSGAQPTIAYKLTPYLQKKYPNYRMYFSEADIGFFTGYEMLNPKKNHSITSLTPDFHLKENEVIIWDNWFSRKEDGIALETLAGNPTLRIDTMYVVPLSEVDTMKYVIFVKQP